MDHASSFCQRLAISHPIIQAPMAGVATPALAAAVSNAGGLGSLGIGSNTTAQARDMIRATASQTQHPFNVNVFTHAPARRDATREAAWLQHLAPLFARFGGQPPARLEEIYPSFLADDSILDMLLEERPAVVSFHFGLPRPEQARALREAGIFLMASATSLDEARRIEAAGLDAVVAQGIEAGGHRGIFDPEGPDEALGTLALLQRLHGHIGLPVIAAGGLMTGADICAALNAGAAAAQLGTAFVPCPESSANAAYRDRLLHPAGLETRLTTVLSGRPARGLLNDLIRHGTASGSPRPADYPLAYDAAKQLSALAISRGDHGYAAQWAGQSFARARAMPASELMQTLLTELAASASA
ncbi:MAG: Nitronate monooxygenase [Kerstersia gyiorum]|uniref:NAD(P)H-dependent flavin oxidoreductase n=1 Tax=Kerstersia gyiorum TaxID=206506 RepID=UPI0030CFB4B4